MDNYEGLQITDVFAIIRRRGMLVVRVAGAILLAVFWIAMAMPNQFEARALILVEPQSVSDELVAAGVRESDLSERLGIMTSEILSRRRLSSIITDLHLYPEMEAWYTREEVVDHMRKALSVTPVFSQLEQEKRQDRNAVFNTFAVTFLYESPTVSADVVNRIASDFISEHIDARVRVSQKSLEFMRASMDDLSRRIVVVDSDIKKVKESNSGRLPEDLLSNQRIEQQLISDLRAVEQALANAQSDEAFWNNQVIAAVAITKPNDRTDPSYRIKELTIMVEEMRGRGYTERHPDIIASKAEMAALEQALEEARLNKEQTGGAESYAEQNARSELNRSKLRVASSSAELERLQAQLAQVEARLAATPAVAEKLEALNRESESLFRSYQDFSIKLQQASVQADMERRQLGEQLRILEAAFAPTSPTSPNRPLILALGLLLGLGVGGAAAILVEAGDSSVHGARELQSISGIPVLADIPTVMLESDRSERARRIVREMVVVSAIVVFCLVGGLATYFAVNGAPSFLKRGDADAESEAPQETDAQVWMAPEVVGRLAG